MVKGLSWKFPFIVNNQGWTFFTSPQRCDLNWDFLLFTSQLLLKIAFNGKIPSFHISNQI